MNQEIGSNTPKILIFDIETTPILGYTWGIWEQNVIDIVKPWYMLCFAYKWLGESEVHVVALPDFKERYATNKEDDFELVVALRNLFDQADMIVAHNGDEFDIKKSNARFIAHGLVPPSPYVQIDTKKIAKRYFKFESNSLDKLGDYLGLGRKKETGGFGLWKGCMAGDESSWKLMISYNKQDVRLLEAIYNKLKPWHRTHPNVGHTADYACPKCGSTDVQKRGYARTSAGTFYQRFQCNGCGGWSQTRTMENRTTLR